MNNMQSKEWNTQFLQQRKEVFDDFGMSNFYFECHKGAVNSVAVTGDGKYIISGSEDKTIAVWDIANKTLLHRFKEAHSDRILSVAVTGDDKYIISGSEDQTIGVWDIANKTLLHRFEEVHSDRIWSLAMTG